ncbi:unnamed protein product [Prorocentrum cordatum]|uniref:Uncharacterized protein n=1 Tax=Prorocentrum cordatum TaxID=2364126 RepID=A0ABN9Y4C6_9DINO|nr:unnamed protein product [Polarella glacialis]
MESLGPPFVHVWTALIKAVGMDLQTGADVKTMFEKYWREVVLRVQVIELLGQVRRCRVRTTRKQESKGEKLRLTFGVDHRRCDQEAPLIKYFNKAGRLKYGPDPRGSLERDAAKMLEQLVS